MQTDTDPDPFAMLSMISRPRPAAIRTSPWGSGSRRSLGPKVTRPMWTWHTENVTSVKNAADGVRHNIACSNGGWQQQLRELAKVLLDPEALKYCDLLPESMMTSQDQAGACDVLLDFLTHLMANRAFSGMPHDGPPLCYAALLGDDLDAKLAAVSMMKSDWQVLVAFENARHSSLIARDVFTDLEEVIPPAVRLLFLAFEAAGWRADAAAGLRILRCMVGGLPDSKLVEDTHQHLRDLGRANRNNVSSKTARSRACLVSNTLEERSVQHRRITEADFISGFHAAEMVDQSLFMSGRQTMGPEWHALHEKRDWVSLTPESSRASWMCWRWLKTWCVHGV